ncbi:MAG: GFA family protein [Candidatus Pacebacteria bacterium]|nr:GFA family protein [Candidatus Paceibacterota bacterium]
MEGGCHCKAVRFKTENETFWVGACYCIDCRNISGAPYVVWAGFETDAVKILQGTPKIYSSSEQVNRSFCENCGSPFSYQYKEKQDKVFLPVGIFDNAASFEIKKHIWVSQKLPWIHITDGLPQEDRSYN